MILTAINVWYAVGICLVRSTATSWWLGWSSSFMLIFVCHLQKLRRDLSAWWVIVKSFYKKIFFNELWNCISGLKRHVLHRLLRKHMRTCSSSNRMIRTTTMLTAFPKEASWKRLETCMWKRNQDACNKIKSLSFVNLTF